jgi:hypothetical protein
MDCARNNNKAYQASLHQKQPTERCKARWKVDVETDVVKMGIVNGRQSGTGQGWMEESN